MPHAALIYNPVAGRSRNGRRHLIESAAQFLRSHGWTATLEPTISPASAGFQAAAACATGADVIFACGGDGTVHEVLQGVVGQSRTALGILPLGTANVLALHLGVSRNILKAINQQLNAHPQSVPVGRVTFQTATGPASRYFVVMAGAGPDGELVYRMLASGKHRFGRLAYYVHAAHLYARTRFPAFAVTSGDESFARTAVSAMAVRVGDLGGLFSPLIRGADLRDPHLHLTITRPPGQLSFASWVGMSWLRLARFNRFTETRHVQSFTCDAPDRGSVQVQADGEWLGRTPMHVELVPNALQLLFPRSLASACSEC